MKELQRLDKVLSHMGWGTRTEIKKIIKKGFVKVDGETVIDPACKIRPQSSKMIVNGESIEYKEFIYLMMNKPAGCVSATTDNIDKTVLDLLAPEDKAYSPFPVGRLDKDTEGLLLLTNDGDFVHNIISPKKKVPKTYYAKIKGMVTATDVQVFAGGVVLNDGYKTLPAELNVISSADVSEITLVIYEGKYHQVKRMFQACQKEVLYLKRLVIGSLALDDNLDLGEYRELTEEELAPLREQ